MIVLLLALALLVLASVIALAAALSMHASVREIMPLLRKQVAATPAARSQLSNEIAIVDLGVKRNGHALARIEEAMGIVAHDLAASQGLPQPGESEADNGGSSP